MVNSPTLRQSRRRDFARWCGAHGIELIYGGQNWHAALNGQAFLCGILLGRKDFNAVTPLVRSGKAYIASALGWHGPRWLCVDGLDVPEWDDCRTIERDMEHDYLDYLSGAPGAVYYGPDILEWRDHLMHRYPAAEGESVVDHMRRLSIQAGRPLPPAWAIRPGYWHVPTGEELHPDAYKGVGLWWFDAVPGGSWTRYVIALCAD